MGVAMVERTGTIEFMPNSSMPAPRLLTAEARLWAVEQHISTLPLHAVKRLGELIAERNRRRAALNGESDP